MILIDSSGWIERFTSGSRASRYNKVIDNSSPSQLLVPSIIVYEVYRKIKKLKGEQLALEASALLSRSKVVELTPTIALEAADYSLEFNLHMADAIVYATARHHGATLYTSDRHLRDLRGVVVL